MYQRESKIKLLNTDLLVTAERFDHDVFIDGVIRYNKGDLKDIQNVISISEYVKTKGIKIGDKVKINLGKYIKIIPKHKYDNAIQRTQAPEGREVEYIMAAPILNLKNNEVIHADYSDILYIVEEVENIDDSGLIVPKTNIIS